MSPCHRLIRPLAAFVLPALLSLAVGVAPAHAVPSGFAKIHSADGIAHYKKDYKGGQPDHVLVVDLGKAHLRSFTGDMKDAGAGKGPLGGPNPSFSRRSLAQHWGAVKAKQSGTFAVVNAQFFVTAANPTPLAFSVRANGAVLSDGYGIKAEFPGQIRLLQLHGPEKWARIVGFSENELENGAAPEMVAVLDENANKGVNTLTGRTFAGVRDANGDGKGETAYIFCSKYASQKDASKVLKAFGATAVGMLDGGGSSQLIVQGKSQVYSSRTIPHVLAVISGPAPQPPPKSPQIEIWSKTSAKDFRPEGASKGIGDLKVGQTADVDIFVRCKASGGPTADHVKVGYWLQKPWLVPVTWWIHSDWPHKNQKTWGLNDSDGFKHNPSKSKPPTNGQFDISAMSPGETKRIRIRVRAADYSIGAADHPDVRAWIWHVGNYYGEQTGWDDKVETNKAGKILRTHVQHDVYGPHFWRWNGGVPQTEGWRKGGDIGELKVNTQDHCLAVKGNGGDPWFESGPVSFAAKSFKGFKMRARSHGGIKRGQLHWLTKADGKWTGGKSAWFQLKGDGKFRDVQVLTANNPKWKGTITRVRIDPSLGSKDWYDLDWLRADAKVTGTTGDGDLDGSLAVDDCDDKNAAVHPGAKEKCNGKDDDCDGKTDEGCPEPDAGSMDAGSPDAGSADGGSDDTAAGQGDGGARAADTGSVGPDGGGRAQDAGDLRDSIDGVAETADLPARPTPTALVGNAPDGGCASADTGDGAPAWMLLALVSLALLRTRRRAAYRKV